MTRGLEAFGTEMKAHMKREIADPLKRDIAGLRSDLDDVKRRVGEMEARTRGTGGGGSD
jgi:hypothetical protein